MKRTYLMGLILTFMVGVVVGDHTPLAWYLTAFVTPPEKHKLVETVTVEI
jgi:hypothetical protein